MEQRTVFVVDDDPSVRDAFTLALSDWPGVVKAFPDGTSAIEATRAERPDLVFLDLRMPGLNGVQTLAALLEIHADLDVFIVTAFADEFLAELRAAREAGSAFQLLAKPLGADEIRAVVQTWEG